MKTPAAYLLSLLLICLLLNGCDGLENDYISKYCPGSCTVIKGRLTTANGTKPLPNVALTVTWQVSGFYIGVPPERKKGYTQTDENGNYELRFLIRDDELVEGHFLVEPALDMTNYAYCNSQELDSRFYELERDTTLLNNFEIPEKAFLKFELKNPEALQSGDTLTTQSAYLFGKDGKKKCYYSIQWNASFKSTEVVEVAADQPLVLEQTKIKNGVEKKEQITVQLKAGETKVVATDF